MLAPRPRPVPPVDIDKYSLETFENNHNAPSYNIDLSDVEPDNLLNKIDIQENKLDGIIGGPPC